ncbi:MAG TPA: response regulator [Candidatus Saccharimonadales bacterium]|nr:response regulator [Candidatus Saccharimonadales bacterium]
MSYVLLVEPNTLLAKTYTQAMQRAGHEVVHTTSAQAAITAADTRTPDIVVLELQLPVHNGVEFLQEFRSYAEWQEVPVVVHTGITPSHLAGDGREALQRDMGVGVIAYKPHTSLQDLVRLVREQSA